MKATYDRVFIIISILLFCFCAFIADIFADTQSAASVSYDDVSAAVSAASAGDTVEVPSGSATWSNRLTITKGLWLKGAGIDQTIITYGSSNIIKYAPSASAIANNEAFVLTGFTLDGNDANVVDGMLNLTNTTTTAITNVVISNNKFKRGRNGIFIRGSIYGVACENEFDLVYTVLRDMGLDRISWDNLPYSYGSVDNFYFEDNRIYFSSSMAGIGWVEGGQGGRYVLRYNTWDLANTSGFPDIWDIHGNQSAAGEQYSTIVVEIYGNMHINGRTGRWVYDRGGQTLTFNNVFNSASGQPVIQLAEEYDDSLSPSNFGIQHINNTYYWNNTHNGTTTIHATERSDCCNAIAENSEFYNYNASFDGTTGIGIGPSPPAISCTKGVGYWVTNAIPGDKAPNTMADLKSYSQTGKFYKATATNTWTLYYTPFTYPHPLRAVHLVPGGAPPSPPAPPSQLRINQ